LISRPSIADHRELIIVTVTRLTGGSANLWLSHAAFHLPGMDDFEITSFPIIDAINHVIETKRTYRIGTETEKSTRSWHLVAVPLIAQDTLVGVLQVERSSEHLFNQDEIDLLEALATHAAVSMQVTRTTILSWCRSTFLRW